MWCAHTEATMAAYLLDFCLEHEFFQAIGLHFIFDVIKTLATASLPYSASVMNFAKYGC